MAQALACERSKLYVSLISLIDIKPQGLIAFEHGFDQGQAVQDLLLAAGLQKIKTLQDHGGNDRVTLGWAASIF